MAGDDPASSNDANRTQAHRYNPHRQETYRHNANRYQPESNYTRSEQAHGHYSDGEQTHSHRSNRHRSDCHDANREHALCRVADGDDTAGAPRRTTALAWTQGDVDKRQSPPGSRRSIFERHLHHAPSANRRYKTPEGMLFHNSGIARSAKDGAVCYHSRWKLSKISTSQVTGEYQETFLYSF
jgi:hypothetical protein